MNDRDKNLQHALLSFALLGGMLVTPRRPARPAEGRFPDNSNTERRSR